MGVSQPEGCTAGDLATFESTNGVLIPDDMRQFYARTDGMGGRSQYDDLFYSFWGLRYVEKVPTSILLADPTLVGREFFGFADHGIELPYFAIELSNFSAPSNTVLAVYPYNDPTVLVVAGSFTEFLNLYLESDSSRDRLEFGPLS